MGRGAAFLSWLVQKARFAYSKNGSNRICASTPDDGQFSDDTVHDLFTDFICEYGPTDREFDYNDPLTIELSNSTSIARLRAEFYRNSNIPFSGIGQMEPKMFMESRIFDLSNETTKTRFMGIDDAPVTIVDFLGGYDWNIYKTVRNTVRFEIDNETSLMSGTRIWFSSDVNDISLELYLQDPSAFNRDGSIRADLSRLDKSKYNIISILSNKPSESRNPSTISGLGGGTMRQRFIWEEIYVSDWSCNRAILMITLGPNTSYVRPAPMTLPVPKGELFEAIGE